MHSNNVARLRKMIAAEVALCVIEEKFDAEDQLSQRDKPIVDCTDAPEHLPAA